MSLKEPHSMSELKCQLTEIINKRHLTTLFQPIVCLSSQQIFSFEALIRGPSNSVFHNPINLFSYAEKFELGTQLEHACRHTSIRQYADLKLPHKLFLNTSPSVLLQSDFKKDETLRYLADNGISPESVVIEVTEQQPIDDYDIMRDAINHCRSMGFQIALDDLGAGYSGLRLWTELMPDYVKIDRHFIQDIDKDPIKLCFVRSIQSMALVSNCHIIAEGVETEAEFHAIEALGITYAQGHYFAHPCANPKKDVSVKLFSSLNNKKSDDLVTDSTKISSLIHHIEPIGPETIILKVLDLFRQDSELTLIPIVKNKICMGIIYKDQFLTKLFASKFGMELHGTKPIGSFLTQKPITFDSETPTEQVSQKLTHATHNAPAFMITQKGGYFGVGTIIDLLEKITTQQIENAQHSNPLTLLPGVTPMNDKINRLLSTRHSFSIAYFDLDHFKPFNDHYGYDAGDEAIKLVARLIQEFSNPHYSHIGHIGGDDFIVIYQHCGGVKNCKAILEEFKNQAPKLYKETDRNSHGIHGFDRQGRSCFFPLLSLSIGIVPAESVIHCSSHMEISDLAAEAKHQAKIISGNSYFINRRCPISVMAKEINHPSFLTTQHRSLKVESKNKKHKSPTHIC
jgi:diguanylate cyclase (GGDEF)-like protein